MKPARCLSCAFIASILVATGACGEPKGEREVAVAMTDNAFTPNTLTVSAGETVAFKFTNNGAVAHDAFIGDTASQQEHETSMRKAAGGGHDHGGEALTLEPGSTDELPFTFDKAGEVLIGCHQPGHYAGGMKASVTVS